MIPSQTSQSLADALEERLIDFAVRIIKLSANLPQNPAGKHIAGQILRAGTSPVLTELNETSIWLRIIKRSRLLREELLADIIEENKSLSKIFTASLKTSSHVNRKATTNEKCQTTNGK